MLLSEFVKARGNVGVTTESKLQSGSINNSGVNANNENNNAIRNSDGNTFAQALKAEIEQKSNVEFSNHAIKRIESRSIDLSTDNTLERLNKGVEIAAEKGSNESLILVDTTAFVVSVKNNTVITTMSQEDLIGNIFTNIDSTVII